MSTNMSKLSRVKELQLLLFFVALAKPLQEFLLKFQINAPITIFLPLSLKDLLLSITGHFLKKKF